MAALELDLDDIEQLIHLSVDSHPHGTELLFFARRCFSDQHPDMHPVELALYISQCTHLRLEVDVMPIRPDGWRHGLRLALMSDRLVLVDDSQHFAARRVLRDCRLPCSYHIAIQCGVARDPRLLQLAMFFEPLHLGLVLLAVVALLLDDRDIFERDSSLLGLLVDSILPGLVELACLVGNADADFAALKFVAQAALRPVSRGSGRAVRSSS